MSNGVMGNSGASTHGLLGQRERRPDKKEARRAFWRMLALVRPHRRRMTLGIVLGLGVALTYAASLGGILPVLKVIVSQESLRQSALNAAQHTERWYAPTLEWFAGFLPEGSEPTDRMKTLMLLVGALVAVNLVGNILRCLSQYCVLYASHRMMMDLRRDMYRKSLRVPVRELTGDVSNRVNQFMSDSREVFLGVVTLFGKVAREPLKAVCVLAVAFMLDFRLTIVVLAIAPVAVGVLWYFGRKVRKATTRLLQGYGEMLGGLEETLQGIDVVKGYAREGHERRRMWRIERRMFRQLLKLAWIESLASPLIEVVGVIATSLGIVWLAARQFRGEIEPSLFITMVGLLAAMLDPVRKVANVYNVVQRSGAAATRIFEFLDLPEEQSPPRAKRLRGSGPRAVQFEHVTYRYTPTQEPAALDDVSVDIQPGECVAIVGPNGSGKSTLLKAVPRLLDPQRGRVLIDGTDVRDLSLRNLRQQIAVVTQHPVIFARSVAENIAYGNARASAAEIRAAAEQAYAAEFIEQWPDKYETVMGEFGASVSGGQRQRIAIARAFLKPASIVIFDEATSEIDAESERKIHAALNVLRQGKTTFLIAHRHTVMEMAERIVVMDVGRIVDVGTQAELLDRCPLFVALYRSPVNA
jgi:ABC-type multidrug transport system fused ATPase/permease subunit